MKVKDFIMQIEEIGYNDNTEIVFNMSNNDEENTVKDYYCHSIYAMMPFTLNAIGIDISGDYIIGRRLTDKEASFLAIQDINFNKEEFEEVLKTFIRKDK